MSPSTPVPDRRPDMEIIDVTQDQLPEQTPLLAAAPVKPKRFRVTRSKKMLVGLVILGAFVLLAIIGPWIAPYNPNGLGDLVGPPLPDSTIPSQLPGSHHLLGQTNIGGDILSQLLAGARPTLEGGFLPGGI